MRHYAILWFFTLFSQQVWLWGNNEEFSWNEQKFEIMTDNRIRLSLDDGFESGRGRLNCTSNNKGNWHWFGYQFLIK